MLFEAKLAALGAIGTYANHLTPDSKTVGGLSAKWFVCCVCFLTHLPGLFGCQNTAEAQPVGFNSWHEIERFPETSVCPLGKAGRRHDESTCSKIYLLAIAMCLCQRRRKGVCVHCAASGFPKDRRLH